MAYDPTTKTFTVYNEADLNQAIADIDAVGRGGQLAGGDYTIRLAQDIVLGGPTSGNVKDVDGTTDLMVNGGTVENSVDLKAINLSDGTTLTIDGSTHTIDGAGATRGLFVYNGAVSIHDLTIANTLAKGGSGAGGGGGFGGGLFVAGPNPVTLGSQTTTPGGVVTLTDVSFTNNKARGGAGTNTSSSNYIGGGGLGGDGAHDGGGGVGLGARGATSATPGDAAAMGGPGIIVGAASGGSGKPLKPGEMGYGQVSTGPGGRSGGGGGAVGRKGAAAGGGGGVNGTNVGYSRDVGSNHGTGGFGGGGSAAAPKGGAAGDGGFGGGGGSTQSEKGSTLTGGNGGFGGGGGNGYSVSAGGFGGGNGAGFGGDNQSGGGGLGAGGAIFVQAGGQLILGGNVSISGGAVTPGGGPGMAGQAFASGIYLQGNGGPLVFDTTNRTDGSGATQTVSDAIGDDTGSAAAAGYTSQSGYTPGSVGITVQGNGFLVLSGANTYTGTTTLKDTASLVGGVANTFSAASAFVVGKGTNVLLNFDQTIASLADGAGGGGDITAGLLNATLTIAGSATTSFSGTIVDGSALFGGVQPLTLVKQGSGKQTLAGANTYSGGTTIKGGTLDLETAETFVGGVLTKGAAGTGAIRFAATSTQAASTVLALGAAAQPGNAGTFGNTLDDFGDAGEALDLAGYTGTVQATFVPTMTGSTSGTLTVTNGTKTEIFKLTNAKAALFTTRTDDDGGTFVEAVCFAQGTAIRTSRGEVPVEALVVGDLAITASGRLRPICWLGQRTMDCRREPGAHPVRIAAHAFGSNVPARELRLSPGHPVLVGAEADGEGGVLVPIMCLINGTTIERVPVDEVTYWHIELDEHDILLAEGLPAESYLDWGDRGFFTEGSDHALANPDFVVPGLAGRCRPVAIDGPVVEAERRRLDGLFAMRLATMSAWPSEDVLTGF